MRPESYRCIDDRICKACKHSVRSAFQRAGSHLFFYERYCMLNVDETTTASDVVIDFGTCDHFERREDNGG